MTVHTTFPGPARGTRTRSRKPRPVRPRFKQPSQAALETHHVALRRLRLEAEAAVEHLLAVLDALDADADLEPAGDEEDASYPEGGDRVLGFHGAHEDAEDGADVEPSLCGKTADCRGFMWSSTSGLDLEEEAGNDEPSLGWTDEETARGRVYAGSMGDCADLEEQCEDEGSREAVLI